MSYFIEILEHFLQALQQEKKAQAETSKFSFKGE